MLYGKPELVVKGEIVTYLGSFRAFDLYLLKGRSKCYLVKGSNDVLGEYRRWESISVNYGSEVELANAFIETRLRAKSLGLI